MSIHFLFFRAQQGPEFDPRKAHFSAAEVEKVRPLAENPSKERRGGRRECTDAVLAPPLSRRSRNAPWPRKTRKRTRKMGVDAKKLERRDRFKTTKRAATHGRSRLQRQAHPRRTNRKISRSARILTPHGQGHHISRSGRKKRRRR